MATVITKATGGVRIMEGAKLLADILERPDSIRVSGDIIYIVQGSREYPVSKNNLELDDGGGAEAFTGTALELSATLRDIFFLASSGGGVSLSDANTWTADQTVASNNLAVFKDAAGELTAIYSSNVDPSGTALLAAYAENAFLELNVYGSTVIGKENKIIFDARSASQLQIKSNSGPIVFNTSNTDILTIATNGSMEAHAPDGINHLNFDIYNDLVTDGVAAYGAWADACGWNVEVFGTTHGTNPSTVRMVANTGLSDLGLPFIIECENGIQARKGVGSGAILSAVLNTTTRFAVYNNYTQILNITSYANDAAAAIGGVPVGGLYHTSGALKIRVT